MKDLPEKQVQCTRVTASESVSIKDREWRRDASNQNAIIKTQEEYHDEIEHQGQSGSNFSRSKGVTSRRYPGIWGIIQSYKLKVISSKNIQIYTK